MFCLLNCVLLGHAVVQREELAQDDEELLRDAARKLGAELQRLCVGRRVLQPLYQLLPLPARPITERSLFISCFVLSGGRNLSANAGQLQPQGVAELLQRVHCCAWPIEWLMSARVFTGAL